MKPKPLIGIIGGSGKMGRYFADFFRKNGFEVIISDRNTKLTNVQLAKQADVVMVSVPIGATERVIREVAPHVKKSGLLMDTTSLKTRPMEAMMATKASFLGFHPLFGPTTGLQGQIAIVCKGRGAAWHKWWLELLKKNGVTANEMTARQHDHLMAYVQVLSHFSDLALADALRLSGLPIGDFLKHQSPPYRLRLDVMGRILNQDPDLYARMQTENPESVRVISGFLRSAENWMHIVEEKKVDAFVKNFQECAKYLGSYKTVAMEESDWLIRQLGLRTLEEKPIVKPKSKQLYDVAALGPENSFSSLAAKGRFPDTDIKFADSIADVFDEVKKGAVKKGVVPIENRLAGSVAETLDGLFESDLKIQESFELPIHHCLATHEKIAQNDIRAIYSHAQPLRQCRRYLAKHFPKAQLIALPSTTAALEKALSEPRRDMAVICSEKAAKNATMTIIAKNIEDSKSNATRFVVIGKKLARPKATSSHPKTSIAFCFSTDAPGTLYQVLGGFAKAKVNMTKIESSTNPSAPGGHVFFIDLEGSADQPNVKKMLSAIRKHVAILKVLGGY